MRYSIVQMAIRTPLLMQQGNKPDLATFVANAQRKPNNNKGVPPWTQHRHVKPRRATSSTCYQLSCYENYINGSGMVQKASVTAIAEHVATAAEQGFAHYWLAEHHRRSRRPYDPGAVGQRVPDIELGTAIVPTFHALRPC